MPYLNACIKEALRIHPAVQFTLPRVVPPAGLQLHGHTFAPGVRYSLFEMVKVLRSLQTVVGVNAYHIHQHTEIFGENCDKFRPERWLIEDKVRLGSMEKNLFSVSL